MIAPCYLILILLYQSWVTQLPDYSIPSSVSGVVAPINITSVLALLRVSYWVCLRPSDCCGCVCIHQFAVGVFAPKSVLKVCSHLRVCYRCVCTWDCVTGVLAPWETTTETEQWINVTIPTKKCQTWLIAQLCIYVEHADSLSTGTPNQSCVKLVTLGTT